MAELSPMMQHYLQLKEQHKDQLLFYRVGDFYEMFFDDAVTASKALELVLTGKECGLPERAPMCGVPYHSCETYIARLIKKGFKVAVCNQMEDPKLAKGLVRREVVRVYTPGTLIESAMLDEGANNYIASVYRGEDTLGLAFADVSTGRMYAECVPADENVRLQNELSRYQPSEIICNETFCLLEGIGAFLTERIGCSAQPLDEDVYSDPAALRALVSGQFGEELFRESGLSELTEAVYAAGARLA